jgi:hypothetical protein
VLFLNLYFSIFLKGLIAIVKKIIKNIGIIVIAILFCYLVIYLQNEYFSSKSTNSTVTNNATIEDISYFKNKINTTENSPPAKDFQGYGIKLFNSNGKMIENNILPYKDGTLSYYISFINANPYSDYIGFMIIIDGKVQPFCIDDDYNEKFIHNEKMKPYSSINIPIKFNPIIAKTNGNEKKHLVYFLAIYKQNILPDQHTKYIDSYTAPYICELQVSNDSDIIKKATNQEIVKFSNSNMNKIGDINNWTGINKGTTIEAFKQDNNLILNSEENNGEYTFGSVLPEGLYSTIIFVDNKPIKFSNNEQFIIWQSKKDELMFYTFNINSNLSKGIHQIYSITLPLQQSNNMQFFESGKIKINIK